MSSKKKLQDKNIDKSSHNALPYAQELHELQLQMAFLQQRLVASGERVLIIFEGRDAAGKDGAIKRLAEFLDPHKALVVALSKPTEHEQASWYFQRYVAHLPANGEMVLFNRSWYNRAGVERVMGFCSEADVRQFLAEVVPFEQMLANTGIRIIKFYLDIDKDTQRQRIQARQDDPLKQWKVGPLDKLALKSWKKYSAARNAMLERTDHAQAPWIVVKADDKDAARLNIIREVLAQLASKSCPKRWRRVDPEVVIRLDPSLPQRDKLAP